MEHVQNDCFNFLPKVGQSEVVPAGDGLTRVDPLAKDPFVYPDC